MNVATAFWDQLIDLNKSVDRLVGNVLRARQPSQPIGREIPFNASIEISFDNIPTAFSSTISPNSDAIDGNNVKRGIYQNGGSRACIREIGIQSFYIATFPTVANQRFANGVADANAQRNAMPAFHYRWNLMTSITERRYFTGRRGLAASADRSLSGCHLCFREPLILEPREAAVFEVELLSSQQSFANTLNPISYGFGMILSGYREGV